MFDILWARPRPTKRAGVTLCDGGHGHDLTRRRSRAWPRATEVTDTTSRDPRKEREKGGGKLSKKRMEKRKRFKVWTRER